jgi:hypothetical protein
MAGGKNPLRHLDSDALMRGLVEWLRTLRTAVLFAILEDRDPDNAALRMTARGVLADRAAAHQPGKGGEWAELETVIPAHPSRGNPPWPL